MDSVRPLSPTAPPLDAPPTQSSRRAGRWLAFLPSALLFIIAARTSGNSGDERLYFHDELLAAGFIAAFLALLWVASRRIAQSKISRPLDPSRGRGFEVVATGNDAITRTERRV